MKFFRLLKRLRIPARRKEKPFVPFKIEKHISGNYENFEKKLLNSSLILLIAGKRGSGKTALGMKFLELFHRKTRKKCYILNYKHVKLPRWIKKASSIEEIPDNAIVLIDEGAILFSARDAMKESNKLLSKLMIIARHKNLSLILISQNSSMIDLNVLRLADSLILKEPSLLQAEFERPAIKKIYKKVEPHFKKLENKNVYFYLWDDDFEGLVKYNLPEFWSEAISKSFKKF